MKMTKKITALLLALVMTLSLSTMAFANGTVNTEYEKPTNSEVTTDVESITSVTVNGAEAAFYYDDNTGTDSGDPVYIRATVSGTEYNLQTATVVITTANKTPTVSLNGTTIAAASSTGSAYTYNLDLLNKAYAHSPKMLENDADAISYVVMQRNGMKYETIESCPSIFLTTNNNLVREANQFLHYQAYRMWISPLITDTDLTSILWVKYSMQNRQIPRLLLVSAASAAVTPTSSVMERFYDITVRMSKRGDLTEDEAANLRFSTYARAEIMDLCGGNYDALDDTSVLAVRDRVKAQYAKEATIVASKALEDVAEANRRYDAASEKLLAQQATVKSSIGKLRRDARENADNRARNISYWVKNCAATLLIIIMIVSAVVTVATGVNDSKGIISLAAIIISGGGAVSLWVPLLKLGKKLQDFVFIHTEGKMYMKELEKISPQIKLLEDILNSNSDS